MAMQARHSYLLSIFEKLGTPLLAAVTEATERDRLQAEQEGRAPDDSPTLEAERIASLLKSSAEMGFGLSRQLDLRMSDPAEADGVRLTLATVVAPLVANLYRINGRTPTTPEVERISSALQAVTLFADNYNAAADANVRMQLIDQDFAPADGAQVQLNLMHALMPAINAVCTFSYGQPEKALLQDVMERLNATAQGIRAELFGDLPERDALRAEISLLRASATLYSQAHFTEMSKLMFMEESQREGVDLNDRLQTLWAQVDQRLAMLRVMAETLATGTNTSRASGTAQVAPAKAPSFVVNNPPAAKPAPVMPPPSAPAAADAASAANPAVKTNPMAFFSKPKEMGTNGEQA